MSDIYSRFPGHFRRCEGDLYDSLNQLKLTSGWDRSEGQANGQHLAEVNRSHVFFIPDTNEITYDWKKDTRHFFGEKRHGLENCFLPCFFKAATKTFFKKFFVQKLEKRFGLVFTSCLLLDSNFYLFFVRLERSCIERFTAGWTNKA